MQGDLFGESTVVKKKKKEYWEVSKHACKNCMGKILTRRVSPTVNECMCSECGARSYGSITTLCFCGQAIGIHGNILECVENTNHKPFMPTVLVKEKAVVLKPTEHRQDRSVYCPESYD